MRGLGSSLMEPEVPLSDLLTEAIPRRVKWWLLVAAWCTVFLSTLATNPAYLITAPSFPVGLAAWLPHGAESAAIAWMLVVPVTAGWVMYLILSWFLIRARKRGLFLFLYIVLCVLLALNVIGCQRALEPVS